MHDTAAVDDTRRATIRARFEATCGPWPSMYDSVLEADPELMDAFVGLCAVPASHGHLDPTTRELIGIAVNASTSHLYEPAVRAHIRNAFALGAEAAEIIEVLELTSVLGIHTCTMAMPVLSEELAATNGSAPPELDARQREVKERFLEGRGIWPPFLEDMLRLDVELIEAYLAFSTVPWKKGRLSPKVRELVYIAIDASTTHLYETGTRMHIQNALRAGATKEEIVEVLELIAQIGIHACTMAIPVLLEEAATSRAR